MDADEDAAFEAQLAALTSAAEKSHQALHDPALPPRSGPSKAATPAKVTQPTPHALPPRSIGSSIIVSTTQKGNPALELLSSKAWEYGDIPADYVLGQTTCALFLSLKYHRLHPEYIYKRISDLRYAYNLRLLLVLVDIDSHEEPLRDLSKTSLINGLTVMVCWSSKEVARYLEVYKGKEFAQPTSIKGHRNEQWKDRYSEFVTALRSVSRPDALGMITMFGSVRAAINAEPAEVAGIGGWGEVKVDRWVKAVREPFKVESDKVGSKSTRAAPTTRKNDQRSVQKRPAEDAHANPDEEEALGMASAGATARHDIPEQPSRSSGSTRPLQEAGKAAMSDGIAAALAKLREQ